MGNTGSENCSKVYKTWNSWVRLIEESLSFRFLVYLWGENAPMSSTEEKCMFIVKCMLFQINALLMVLSELKCYSFPSLVWNVSVSYTCREESILFNYPWASSGSCHPSLPPFSLPFLFFFSFPWSSPFSLLSFIFSPIYLSTLLPKFFFSRQTYPIL